MMVGSVDRCRDRDRQRGDYRDGGAKDVGTAMHEAKNAPMAHVCQGGARGGQRVDERATSRARRPPMRGKSRERWKLSAIQTRNASVHTVRNGEAA